MKLDSDWIDYGGSDKFMIVYVQTHLGMLDVACKKPSLTFESTKIESLKKNEKNGVILQMRNDCQIGFKKRSEKQLNALGIQSCNWTRKSKCFLVHWCPTIHSFCLDLYSFMRPRRPSILLMFGRTSASFLSMGIIMLRCYTHSSEMVQDPLQE